MDGVLGLMGCEEKSTRRSCGVPIGCRIDLFRSIKTLFHGPRFTRCMFSDYGDRGLTFMTAKADRIVRNLKTHVSSINLICVYKL